MSVEHFIAMDTHCQTTDICVKTRANTPGRWVRVNTTIPEIRAVLEQVRRPRKLVFEEGPLADWLWRNLAPSVDEALVCDPRKNALVAKDGDKDDPIDAGKLCDLFIGGYVRPVHHPETLGRQVAKQTVGLYHERVSARVRQANKVLGLLRRWGVMVKEQDFAAEADRPAVLARIGDGEELQTVKAHVELLLRGYDEAVWEQTVLQRQVRQLAQANEQVMRWCALPGIGPIRAMTLWVYLDTPGRFKSKAALWKYLGIGLVREHSGSGREWVHVERGANRRLKGAILGAAQSAIERGRIPSGSNIGGCWRRAYRPRTRGGRWRGGWPGCSGGCGKLAASTVLSKSGVAAEAADSHG